MLKKLLLAVAAVLVLTAASTDGARAEEHVCIGPFETQRGDSKHPRIISVGPCDLDGLPEPELNKIVNACGRSYDTTHREPPENGHACRVRAIATLNNYRTWLVTKVLSAAPSTWAESRRAADRYLEEQGLLPKAPLTNAPETDVSPVLADPIPEQFRGQWHGFHGTVERLIITQTEMIILPRNADSPRTTCIPNSIRNASDPYKGAIAVNLMCHGDTYSELWAVMKIGGTDVLIVANPGLTAETISGYKKGRQ